MLSTTPPCGYYVQLQHPQALEITAALVVDSCNCSEVPAKAYRAQRLLVANSHNCSPHTERYAP